MSREHAALAFRFPSKSVQIEQGPYESAVRIARVCLKRDLLLGAQPFAISPEVALEPMRKHLRKLIFGGREFRFRAWQVIADRVLQPRCFRSSDERRSGRNVLPVAHI